MRAEAIIHVCMFGYALPLYLCPSSVIYACMSRACGQRPAAVERNKPKRRRKSTNPEVHQVVQKSTNSEEEICQQIYSKIVFDKGITSLSLVFSLYAQRSISWEHFARADWWEGEAFLNTTSCHEQFLIRLSTFFWPVEDDKNDLVA